MSRNFGLIVVGDEILSGKRVDKHMPKVIELLAARGLQLAWAEYVGDVPERITAALDIAAAGAGVTCKVAVSAARLMELDPPRFSVVLNRKPATP